VPVGDDAGVQDSVPRRLDAGAAVPFVHVFVFIKKFRRAADDVVDLEAEHPGKRRIAHADTTVRIDQDHGVGNVAEYGFQQCLLRVKFLGRADLFGRVAETDDAADDGVAQVLRAGVALDDPAILEFQSRVELLARVRIKPLHIGDEGLRLFRKVGDPVAHLPGVS
jgi:hypothetical protein